MREGGAKVNLQRVGTRVYQQIWQLRKLKRFQKAGKQRGNTSWKRVLARKGKVRAYGIYAPVVDVSEIERVRYKNKFRAYVFLFFYFNSLNSPFLGFWVIQTGFWPVPFLTRRWNLCKSVDYFINVNFDIAVDMIQGESKPFTRFQLGKFFTNIRKYIYYEKTERFP